VQRVFPVFKFAWLGIILFITLKPGGDASLFEFLQYPGIDKLGHFGLFFIWSLLHFPQVFGLEGVKTPQNMRIWILTTNSLVLSLITETAQLYIPGRSFDVIDIAADMLGAVTALVAVKIMR
jgi:VanZ family protein